MFTQVYFHKTRVAYDYHLRHALTQLVPNGIFPPPQGDDETVLQTNLQEYCRWDDWKVLGMLSEGKGGEHADRLRRRTHYREFHHTSECPDSNELNQLRQLESEPSISSLIAAREEAGKSWYKIDDTDVLVLDERGDHRILPLSKLSPVVSSMKATRRVSLYARPEQVEEARSRVAALLKSTNAPSDESSAE